MNELVFASGNLHKLKEVREVLGEGIKILGLSEIGCNDEIPETADTLQGNALQKAHFVKEHYGYDCFADDTGLEVACLNNEPGVYSARYAGENKSFMDNMNKVLEKMEGETNRKACFRTVIALLIDGQEHLFEGVVMGKILEHMQGKGGFGYDPIFMPDGFDKSFAEMSLQEKNRISHRGLAVAKLAKFLNG